MLFESSKSFFVQNCTKKNTILGLTPPKKRDNIATVARKCNIYVTICNKNELNGHNIVMEHAN